MPCWVMMYPRSLPRGTPMMHFSEFSLILKVSMVCEGFLQVIDEAITLPCLYNDVINVDL
jgi:hypothetical protein